MSVAAVIGFPIAHSKSPIIHRFWLEQLEMVGDYERIEVAPDDLSGFIATLRANDLVGINVTLPHKQAIMPFCDAVSPLAAAVGAVNTVYKSVGRLVGHNTDVAGFSEPLQGRDWSAKTAVVVGSGGAARAVVWGLKSLGFAQIKILARTVSTAAALLIDFNLDPANAFGLRQSADILGAADVLVNASSLGMAGQPPLDLDLAQLARGATVYDIVYASKPTELLVDAARLGLETHDGVGMLIGQAAEAFSLFYGAVPPRDPANEAQLRATLSA
jgi:shikimate dehydrogenase